MKVKQLADSLKEMSGKARFVSATYRSKSSGELARHTLIVGASYNKVLEDSKLELALMDLDGFASENNLSATDVYQAASELDKSLDASLAGNNPLYTKAGQYETIAEGLKVSLNDGSFELCGLHHAKKVIEPGVFKPVKSTPKTIAKNKIRAKLSVGRYRTLALDSEAIETVRLNGEELEFV